MPTPYDRRVQQNIAEAQRLFSKEGFELAVEDASLVVKDPPRESGFPVVIFLLAIVKDLFDILELTVVGIIITKILSVLFGIVLFFWCLGKLSGGWWKKKLIRYIWKRYIIAMAIEAIPFIAIIPANMIFILMVHNREKKVVKIFNSLLEQLRESGVR